MVNYIWLKISAAVSVICGVYTTYKVAQYLKLKNMKILELSELKNYKDKYIMAQGVVVPLESREIASSIDKVIVYGSQGSRLRTNYIKHISPFNLRNGEENVLINLNDISKIRCEPPESRHELLVYTFSQCLDVFFQQIVAILTGTKYEVARSQKTKTSSIRSGSSVVIYGNLTSISPASLNADIISTSKEAILDSYFKSLTTPTVLLSICSSITLIIGFVYLNRIVPQEPPTEPVPPELECSICLSRKKNTVLFPCKHVCVCDVCLQNDITKCPLCRTRITHQYKIKY